MSDTHLLNDKKTALSQSLCDVVNAVAEGLGLTVESADANRLKVLRATIDEDGSSIQTDVLEVDGSAKSLQNLWALQREGVTGVLECQPECEPSKIAEIAGQILKPYRVRDGRVQLAGCTFEPRPFLKITSFNASANRFEDRWFAGNAEELDAELRESLCLDNLISVEARLRKSDRKTIDTWIQSSLAKVYSAPVSASVVWCRWVDGTVSIQFDNGVSCSIPFQGWARDWIEGSLEPPKFRCAQTQIESYEIVCLDDETVTVAEAVAKCELTENEVLRDRLAKCSCSGKLVLREELSTCPLTEATFLPEYSQTCEWCRRKISPSGMHQEQCRACASPNLIDSSDPVLSGFLESHPEYRKFKRWSGWIDSEIALFVGQRILGGQLVVVDLPSMKIINSGKRSPLSKVWQFDAS